MIRASDPFGQPFRPTGVQLPGWDLAFYAVGLSGFVKCVGLTFEAAIGSWTCFLRFINKHITDVPRKVRS
jgi:hypothetical protein